MASSQLRFLVPTMAERLEAERAVPQVKTPKGWVPAAEWSRRNGSISVLPVREPVVRRGREAVTVEARPVDVVEGRLRNPSGKSSPATTALGHQTRLVSMRHAKREKAAFVWYAKDGEVSMRMTDTQRSLVSAHDAGDESLVGLLEGQSDGRKPGHIESPHWTTALRSGWVIGGPLGLKCETCKQTLGWADWRHPDATRMRNSAFVFCPRHGGSISTHGGRPLHDLVASRRQLDSSLWAQRTDGAVKQVYVLDVLGLRPKEVYVGQTSKDPVKRRLEHIHGIRSGKVFKDPGQVGPLRGDLPDLPALFCTQSALAAEQWVAFVLRYKGMKVHGGH